MEPASEPAWASASFPSSSYSFSLSLISGLWQSDAHLAHPPRAYIQDARYRCSRSTCDTFFSYGDKVPPSCSRHCLGHRCIQNHRCVCADGLLLCADVLLFVIVVSNQQSRCGSLSRSQLQKVHLWAIKQIKRDLRQQLTEGWLAVLRFACIDVVGDAGNS